MKPLFTLSSAFLAVWAAFYLQHHSEVTLNQYHVILMISVQVVVFALLAFPARTLLDSLQVVLSGRANASDAPEMAVGVFAALGRASVLAGKSSAVLVGIYTLFGSSGGVPYGQLLLAGLGVLYGYLGQFMIFAPVEQIAFAHASKVGPKTRPVRDLSPAPWSRH